ncbi:GNAT family N-acetyltransferase [Streptomyces reniochalinae]|uniref:Lysine N-acyltransferase MbtK n=1 Tax=Streptomyces reniochalinae TaxID=2250578 RepID=A0A367E6G2_9ACTN|nr:GNAT family N-acetyltransferase [Streptomyces reniochalinae]RCG13372.1 N-acetyltransferase [Streptomyces reniochalinae]
MPHPQPGSAPLAGTPCAGGDPGADTVGVAETGSPSSDEDPVSLSGPDAEDTLDLELPHEWPELIAQRAAYDRELALGRAYPRDGARADEGAHVHEGAHVRARAHASGGVDAHDGVGTHDPAQIVPRAATARRGTGAPSGDDLLDAPARWPAAGTGAGRFQLVPVRLPRDLPLICAWMNDPAVAAFWELAGPEDVTEAHLRPQLEGDGRSVPCLGVLDGTPMSYWELYRADLDPLARHCRTRPHDTGLHLLVGGVAHRGKGLGTVLLRTVADLVLAQRPRCARVLAEPDVRNVASVAAFLGAGFRYSDEVQLPTKRAALMVRDRALRHVL